jgi:tripartite-type tricarboxylate transporter receptor subunit TctC
MQRRSLAAALGMAVAAVLAAVTPASAEWPEHPVKLIVPYAPGGGTDFIARPWADALSKSFGQPFVIDNRGGAGGAIGTEAGVRSPADGYTFVLTPAGPLTVLPHLRKVAYDPVKDLTPVARVGDLVCGFTIVPSVGVNSVKELIDYAKKNPGKLAYGSAGLGSSTHLRIEMFNWKAGTEILHVPYRGSADALNDLLAGNVQMMNEINVMPHIKSGKLKLLAVNYPTRHPDFPDVPTLAEAGLPDADVPIWYTVFAPTGTAPDIIATFNRKAVEIAKTPEMIARMREISVIVPSQTPAEIAAFRDEDSAANAALIKAANVKLE